MFPESVIDYHQDIRSRRADKATMPATSGDRTSIHGLMGNLNLRPNRNGTRPNSKTTSPRSSDSHLANFRSHGRSYKEDSRGEHVRDRDRPKKRQVMSRKHSNHSTHSNTPSSLKKFFRRGNAVTGERGQDTKPPRTTPSLERRNENSSREPRETRRVRFQENVDDIVTDLCSLIDLRTEIPTYFLRRLADLPPALPDVHRRTLLRTARSAVEVAYGEFARARSAAQGNMPTRIQMFRIPFADVRDFKDYVGEVNDSAENPNDSVRGFGFFDVAGTDCRRAMNYLRLAYGWIVPESAAAEMAEIRWAVERKCMYWSAVTMMKARIGEAARARGSGQTR